tara:strand:- start:47 stop:787 length:741 start_codon:yes stop_codon:yes gene_type:complete
MTAGAIQKRDDRQRKKEIMFTQPREGACEEVVHKAVCAIIKRVVTRPTRIKKDKEKKKRWEKAHPEKAKAQNKKQCKKYYNANKEHHLATQAVWRKNNKATKAASDLKYMQKRRQDPVFRLYDTCRARIHAFLSSKNIKKNGRTEQLIGCSFEALHADLDGRGDDDHIDHIFPLSAYKSMNEKEQTMAMHHTNLQILTTEENLDKAGKLPTKAMADKTLQCNWPPGVCYDDLPDIYEGWATPLRKY